MKKHIFRNRKARHASIAVILTILVITVTILTNTVFGKLATRYNWYTYMLAKPNYDVTEACFDLLADAFDALSKEGVDTKTEIIFCDSKENIQEDTAFLYVYESATAIAERFPEQVTVTCYDTESNPASVRQYATLTDPLTGEVKETTIAKTGVIITDGKDYHRVYSRDDFYMMKTGASSFWAYDGEKRLASGIIRAINPEAPVACLLNNHGELYSDYEMIYLLDDAGYTVRMLDLYKEEIPADCSLIISYNPTSDLVADDLSEISEIKLLEDFLAKSGNNLLVFMGNTSPTLPNYERFLEGWGVDFSYHTTDERTFRYMVNDNANSLTTDGYTIYGEQAAGAGAALLEGLKRPVVFKNATAMDNASTFVSNGDGSYTNGDRTMYELYTGNRTAVSWANGSAVANADKAILMSLTAQRNADGSQSHVGVISATDFATEDLMQSVVYGNTDLLLHTFETFGKNFTPEGLTAKPLSSDEISMITMRQMLIWTVTLTATPVIVATLAAVWVLVKRRRA